MVKNKKQNKTTARNCTINDNEQQKRKKEDNGKK